MVGNMEAPASGVLPFLTCVIFPLVISKLKPMKHETKENMMAITYVIEKQLTVDYIFKAIYQDKMSFLALQQTDLLPALLWLTRIGCVHADYFH